MIKQVNGHEPPIEQEYEQGEVTAYPPEYLPDLQAMQDWASHVQMQAARLFNSGQRIVADFRKQHDSLLEEAHRMEIERQEAINQVNIAHSIRMQRNETMRANVEAMIAYYTGQLPQQQQQQQAQPANDDRRPQQQQRVTPSIFRLIGGKR